MCITRSIHQAVERLNFSILTIEYETKNGVLVWKEKMERKTSVDGNHQWQIDIDYFILFFFLSLANSCNDLERKKTCNTTIYSIVGCLRSSIK